MHNKHNRYGGLTEFKLNGMATDTVTITHSIKGLDEAENKINQILAKVSDLKNLIKELESLSIDVTLEHS